MKTKDVKLDLRRAVFGGCISAVILLISGYIFGMLSGYEAFQLYKTSLPSTRSFCGTLLLALGNILALMLTLLSISASVEIDLKWSHYERVKQIAWFVAVTLISTTLAYLLMNIPIVEAESTSIYWFTYIYYTTLSIAALLGGAFVTIVLLLYNTIRDMIEVMDPERPHWLRNMDEEE